MIFLQKKFVGIKFAYERYKKGIRIPNDHYAHHGHGLNGFGIGSMLKK
jgi:hypothetical protein